MILPIYLYGSEVLRRENTDMDINDKEGIAKLVADMRDTLQVADGCGLAAPQVGINKRVVIVDGRELTDTYDYLKDFYRVMINPVVLEESEDTCEYSEGCLSVPGKAGTVTRPNEVTVKAYNLKGQEITVTGTELLARALCHEIDHLDGIVYVEKVEGKLWETAAQEE